jgi:hypothetical protein
MSIEKQTDLSIHKRDKSKSVFLNFCILAIALFCRIQAEKKIKYMEKNILE